MSKQQIIQLIKDHEAKFIDLRFTDTLGKEQHITIPVTQADEDFFESGKMFDGSSISGWKNIDESDMLLMPDTDTAFFDPFYDDATINIRCDILEPDTMQGYQRDPRSMAKRAEIYLQSTGIADAAYFGPEPEFFIFDNINWSNSVNHAFYEIDSEEGFWNSDNSEDKNNTGHRPRLKGGYFPVPPVDAHQNIRSAICNVLEEIGIEVEVHHHEVATGGQSEIGTAFNTLVKRADHNMMLKYIVHNIAHSYGKTATFMPKPLVGDNGSGMHVHISLAKNGDNLFAGDQYGGLSQTALHYIGGIFKHAHAINAFTNASTNSYKRLVPGFEAPIMLAFSARNRSASCRIPWVHNPKSRRIEIRFPDSCGNPYFAFSALMMAGLDGIQNKIDPGEPMEQDLYNLTRKQQGEIPTVATSLEMAIQGLNNDREFLTAGGVFTDDLIDAYIRLKNEEIDRLRMATHPVEFDQYYSL